MDEQMVKQEPNLHRKKPTHWKTVEKKAGDENVLMSICRVAASPWIGTTRNGLGPRVAQQLNETKLSQQNSAVWTAGLKMLVWDCVQRRNATNTNWEINILPCGLQAWRCQCGTAQSAPTTKIKLRYPHSAARTAGIQILLWYGT